MLPFGLKVTWFVLSLTGLLSSLVIFCLGMIWEMDPLHMPRLFCIAQASLSAISWFIMTTSCATITITTALAVLRSHGSLSVVEFRRALRWRSALLWLVIGFPVASTIAYLAVSLKLHVVEQSNDMRCDAAHPIWVRLLSYAGLPLLLAVPSFLLSCACAILLLSCRSHNRCHHPPSRGISDTFTPIPIRRSSRWKSHSLELADCLPDTPVELSSLPSLNSVPPWNVKRHTLSKTSTSSLTFYAIPSPPRSLSAGSTFSPPGRAQISPSVASYAKRYHLPFSWKPSTPRSSPEEDRCPLDSFGLLSHSPSPLVFAPPSNMSSARTSPITVQLFTKLGLRETSVADDHSAVEENPRGIVPGYEDIEGDWASGSMKWARVSEGSSATKSELEFTREVSDEVNEYTVYTRGCTVNHSMRESSCTDLPRACHSSVVWRTIIFQLSVSSTQILAAISSLVDIFSGRDSPTPFGTQHVALVLVAWTPAVVFGVFSWRRNTR